MSSGPWVIVAPYKIKKECYLLRSCLDAGRILLFMVEGKFLPKRKVWSMHNVARYTMHSGRREKARDDFLFWRFP